MVDYWGWSVWNRSKSNADDVVCDNRFPSVTAEEKKRYLEELDRLKKKDERRSQTPWINF